MQQQLPQPGNCTLMRRYLVYTCRPPTWCGGLGDRIKGVLAVFSACAGNNRQFLIDAPGTFDSFQPARINWALPLPEACLQQSAVQLDLIDANTRGKQTLNEAAKGNIPCIKVNINELYEPAANWKAALTQLFRPADAAVSPPYTALHVRTGGNGDFRGIDPPRLSVASVAWFVRRARPGAPVVIVSDSLAVKARASHLCRLRNLQCTYSQSRSVHIDRQKHTESDMLNTWRDFFTLVHSTCLLRSQSGFSEMATVWPGSRVLPNCSAVFPHYAT